VIEGKLHLVAVDVGAAGLLRRLGLEMASRTLARNARVPLPERYIDWEDVDPVETSIASIKLRVPHAGLAELHPSDLATIIDQLAPKDRVGILASLDNEAAADVFEEMEPETQVEVIEDLDPARAADILQEMSPDDAADLVQDLSDETRQEILALMERDEAEELGELLAYPEDTAGGLMTTEFVAIPSSLTCAQAIDRLREMEPDAETIYYVYVVDGEERIVGVLSLRDLIVAPPDKPIAEVMIPEPVTVDVLANEDEVAEVVAHHNLLAVPADRPEHHLWSGSLTIRRRDGHILPDALAEASPATRRAASPTDRATLTPEPSDGSPERHRRSPPTAPGPANQPGHRAHPGMAAPAQPLPGAAWRRRLPGGHGPGAHRGDCRQ
jgi:CBS domain-containing protein